MSNLVRSLLRPTRFVPLVLVLLAFAAPGCGGDDGPAGGGGGGGGSFDAEFVIQPGAFNAGAMAFVPARDTVTVGQVVRIRNGDSIQHLINTLTAGGPNWGTLPAGGSSLATAGTAGTFTFECKIAGHTMNGILVVLP